MKVTVEISRRHVSVRLGEPPAPPAPAKPVPSSQQPDTKAEIGTSHTPGHTPTTLGFTTPGNDYWRWGSR